MPIPKEVYDNPDSFIDFMTETNDRNFEGQHFDRKEIPLSGNGNFVGGTEIKKLKVS